MLQLLLMISAFVLNILLPAAVLACGPSSGGMSNRALLLFNLAPPPKYTYSDMPSYGQMTSARAAESNADRDLQLAILSTLADNGITADTVKLSYEYKAPKLNLAEGNHCTKPGTYVVYDGAILYKCIAGPTTRGKRSRVKREGEDTTTTEGTTITVEVTTAESTTEAPTTDTTASEITTSQSMETTTESAVTTDNPGTETDESTTPVPEVPTTASPVDEPVETVEFQIVGTVTVETVQPIFESQWKMFAELIQEKLEKQHVFFTGAILVEMF